MKLIQSTQKSFGFLGITSDQSTQKYPINWKILMVSLSYGSSTISQLMFLKQTIKSASNFVEYADCVFVFVANILVDLCYAISVFYCSKLFVYIGNCEKLIGKSECNLYVQNLNPSISTFKKIFNMTLKNRICVCGIKSQI